MELKNKSAIITGASRGLGKEIAVQFVEKGASVAICARSERELGDTVEELNRIKTNAQLVFSSVVDIANQSCVAAFARNSLNALGKIDILVNNAGVYGPKGNVDIVDVAEWIRAFEINVFGIIFMCQEVIPLLKRNNTGKIINLSGGGATSPLPGLSAYAASKSAVVRLTETMALELKENNIFVNAIAPGALNTRMLDEIIEDGKDKLPFEFYERALKQKETGGTPLSLGAELCVYLASSESDGITGKLVSAVWDDWRNLHLRLDELKSDIYTLRRIVIEEMR